MLVDRQFLARFCCLTGNPALIDRQVYRQVDRALFKGLKELGFVEETGGRFAVYEFK